MTKTYSRIIYCSIKRMLKVLRAFLRVAERKKKSINNAKENCDN